MAFKKEVIVIRRKIYFIQPTYRDQNGHLLKGSSIFIHSLALPTLSAAVPPYWEKEFCLEFFEDVNYDSDASVIGISSMGYDIIHGHEIAEEFKKRGKTVIFGGHQAHISKSFLGPVCDSIVHGNPGQADMIKILNDIEADRLSSEYFCGVNIDFPLDYSLLMKRKIRFMPVLSSVGCLNQCDFCCTTARYNGHFYLRQVEHVLADLREIRKKTRFVGFVDSNIYNQREYLLNLCQHIIEENLQLRWGAQSTIAIGDDQETLKLLSRAGCRLLFVGFETLNQDNLKWVRKRYVAAGYFDQIERIRKAGISVAGYFILGLDCDDKATFQKLFDFIHTSKIALPIINLLLPAPGTRIFERLKKEKRLLIEREEDFLCNNPLYNTPCNRCFFLPKNMSIEEAEAGYLDLVGQLNSFVEILHRSAVSNPFIAAAILFMNLESRKEYLAMAKAKR